LLAHITAANTETGEHDTDPSDQSGESSRLAPNDEVSLMLSLLRPTGLNIGRRWLAALAMVPPEEQETVVAAVEQRIVETYSDSLDALSTIPHGPTVGRATGPQASGSTQPSSQGAGLDSPRDEDHGHRVQ
jgi:hypothetical protein